MTKAERLRLLELAIKAGAKDGSAVARASTYEAFVCGHPLPDQANSLRPNEIGRPSST